MRQNPKLARRVLFPNTNDKFRAEGKCRKSWRLLSRRIRFQAVLFLWLSIFSRYRKFSAGSHSAAGRSVLRARQRLFVYLLSRRGLHKLVFFRCSSPPEQIFSPCRRAHKFPLERE